MATPNTQFPFLRLPGELRNQIYELALISRHTIEIVSMPARRCKPRRPMFFPDEKPAVHLLATCRQIRSEALSICYSENRFGLGMDDYDYPFLERLREDTLSCLKSITFVLPIQFLDAHDPNPYICETYVMDLVYRFNRLGQLYGPRGLDIAAIHTVEYALMPSVKLSDMRRLDWTKEADGWWMIWFRPFKELSYHLEHPSQRYHAHRYWY